MASIVSNLAHGLLEGALNDVDADGIAPIVELELFESRDARTRATPPPGTMPSSTAARVACMASSTRAFFSFISVSVAAPTLMTATPPTSLASRSCSFSRRSRRWCLRPACGAAHAALDVAGLAAALDDRRVVLVDGDLLGAAKVFDLEVLELDAEVFGDGLATGEGGDVFEHGLAAIAKAGGLDGAACSVPRSLFTTSVASASPSMSSAMISSGLPILATCSRSGSRSFIELIFFSWMRMWDLRDDSIRSGSVTK